MNDLNIVALSDIPYIITKSLYTYDLYNIIIKLIKENTKVNIITSKINMKRDIFQFDVGGKIHESEVEILGVYYKKMGAEQKNDWKLNTFGIWIWGWGHTHLAHQQTFNSRELLQYGINMDPLGPYNYIKQLLITSRGMINDPIQIDIIIAIAIFLRKRKYVYSIEQVHNDHTIITYYLIFNENIINEIYDDIMKEKLIR